MARSAGLPSLGLSPFGGGGSSFDAFSIGAAKSERAYLALRKVEVEWEAGRISNSDYLAALKTYAGTLKANSSDRVSAEARIEQYTYRFERNALEAQVQQGTKTRDDLLAYDVSKLEGLNPSSEEYQQRLGYVNSGQNAIFNDLQDKQQELWSDGKITSAQLLIWYQNLRPDLLANNKDLVDNIAKTTADIEDRVVDERDQRMISDFSQGKVAPSDFILYATAAQGRYAKGTEQYDDWKNRLDDAKDQSIENSIMYRYDLTQRYATLEKFVKDHGTAPKGSSGTSTQTRVVWDGTGWVKKTSTKTSSSGPSPAEVKAWKKLQIEVADAKREMAQIKSKVNGQPGGWVTTDDMIGYYKKIQGRYVAGTSEWYAVQSKLDGLNQQKHAEAVLAKQGIRITYPKVKSEQKEYGSGNATGPQPPKPAASGGGGGGGDTQAAPERAQSGDRTLTLAEFMRGVAKVESGGRYDAVNKSSGAYGKYQIMPSSWRGWAEKWLGDANAKPTPENQETVARKQMQAMYKKLGDWRAVAHAWYTGDYTRNPDKWSSGSTAYVNRVFNKLGMSPTKKVVKPSAPSTTVASPGGGTAPAGGSSPRPAGASTSTARKPASQPEADDDGMPAGMRSPLHLPKGYDGRQYEDFYDGYMDAWKNGQESFTVGKRVYWIPDDIDERMEIADELDARRIDYFVAKSKAYLNEDGSPTSSSMYAVQQAQAAFVDAAENVAIGMTFAPKPGVVKPKGTSPTARNDARHNAPEVIDENGQTSTDIRGLIKDPAEAAKVRNPLAKGIELSDKLDMQLAQIASASRRAFDNGDFRLAYALNQTGVDLVANVKPTLDTYIAKAANQLNSIRSMGGSVPSQANSDYERLLDQNEELGGGKMTPTKVLTGKTSNADPALQLLDEVAGDLKRVLRLDRNGEPVRDPADGEMQVKPNVTLVWKNGKITIDETTPKAVGWTGPKTQTTGKSTVTLAGVRAGTRIARNVQAEYETGIVGFVGGDEAFPIWGKIVAGVDQNGRSFQFAEDPVKGGWYDITRKPLTVKMPAGFSALSTGSPTTQSGLPATPTAGQMGYQFRGPDGTTYALQFDPADSRYAIAHQEDSGGGLLGTGKPTWVQDGKIGGGLNSDLGNIVKAAGWDIDMTGRTGDDRTFSNLAGPVIGYTGAEWRDTLGNTGKSWNLKPASPMQPRAKATPVNTPTGLNDARHNPQDYKSSVAVPPVNTNMGRNDARHNPGDYTTTTPAKTPEMATYTGQINAWGARGPVPKKTPAKTSVPDGAKSGRARRPVAKPPVKKVTSKTVIHAPISANRHV